MSTLQSALKDSKVWIRFVVFFAIGIALRLITQKSPTPENTTSLIFALPAFGVFLLFVSGAFSLGALVRVRLKLPQFSGAENGLFDLTVGSTLCYLISYILYAFNLFSSAQGILLWMLLAFAFAMGSPHLSPRTWFNFGNTKFSKLLMLIPLIIVLLKLIEGLQFHQHGDAYVTYLPAPRLWAVTGTMKGFLNYSTFFLLTSWESLYAWGTALMGLTGGSGLDLTQWFSQWCTGGIGVLGLVFALIAFCQRVALQFPIQTIWFPVVVIAGLQVPSLRWTANLAKHDFGVASWGVAATYFSLFLAPVSATFAFISGLLVGTAVIGKLTLSLLGICIGIAILIQNRKSFVGFVLGGIAGVLPVIIRNYTLTGSPVFPWMPNLFPTPYLTDSQAYGAQHATGVAFQWINATFYAKEIFLQMPLIASLVILFLIPRFRNKSFKLYSVPFAAMILFTFAFRPATEIRYQNAVLILMTFFSTYFSFFLLEEWFNRDSLKKYARAASTVLAIIIIATANITFFTFGQIGGQKFKPISQKFEGMQGTGGKTVLWIRQHLDPKESILTVGDEHPYYLIDFPITVMGQSVQYEKLIFQKPAEDVELSLKAVPFKYLYLATDASFAEYKPTIREVMNRAQKWNQTCKLYESPDSQVWDLPCLKK